MVHEEPELAVIVGRFDPLPGCADALGAALAHYVVLTRRAPDCRNVDLLASAAHPGRLLLVEKWASHPAARAHLDSDEMAAMARAALPHLAAKPDLDLFDTVSAHDLT